MFSEEPGGLGAGQGFSLGIGLFGEGKELKQGFGDTEAGC